jgi:hypothetical protein
MILKHAIRYMELNGSDFITDLENYSNLQRSFLAGYVPDNFTEEYEGFTDKLVTLWIDITNNYQNVIEGKIEVPKLDDLMYMFCKPVFPSEAEETETVFFSSSSLLRKKKDVVKGNKTIDLLVFFGTADIDFNQYLNMELEVIYKVLEQVGDKKKEQQEKERKRKRKGM